MALLGVDHVDGSWNTTHSGLGYNLHAPRVHSNPDKIIWVFFYVAHSPVSRQLASLCKKHTHLKNMIG